MVDDRVSEKYLSEIFDNKVIKYYSPPSQKKLAKNAAILAVTSMPPDIQNGRPNIKRTSFLL